MTHHRVAAMALATALAFGSPARAISQPRPIRLPPGIPQSRKAADAARLALVAEPPGNFLAELSGPRSVRLTWIAPAGATGYLVERAPSSNGPWKTLTAVPVKDTIYVDRTALPNSTYMYHVEAVYADKMNGASNDFLVHTPCDAFCASGCAPPPPAFLIHVSERKVTSDQYTVTVTANDAITGDPLSGTLTVGPTASGPLGTPVSFQLCRSVEPPDGLGPGQKPIQVLRGPCKSSVIIPGRATMSLMLGDTQ